MSESRRERRERERWQKEMTRRLEELDRLDAQYGLGADPRQFQAGSGRHRGLPRVDGGRRRRRRGTGPALPGILVVMLLLGFVFLKSPTTTGQRLQYFLDGLRGDEKHYAFVAQGTDTLPIGWDPCSAITYEVNTQGAPDNWEDLLDEAIAEVEDASGFEFRYTGETADRDLRGHRPEDDGTGRVLIAWATPEEYPGLAGKTVGVGGSSTGMVGNRTYFRSGVVVLDQQAFDTMRGTGLRRDPQLIIAHELGHVLGLDHYDDPGQLMNPEYVGQSGFGDGDREGFERLRKLPCA